MLYQSLCAQYMKQRTIVKGRLRDDDDKDDDNTKVLQVSLMSRMFGFVTDFFSARMFTNLWMLLKRLQTPRYRQAGSELPLQRKPNFM